MTIENLSIAVTTGATIFGLLSAFWRMWLKTALHENNEHMLALINGKYIAREIADVRYNDLVRRIENLEERCN